MEKKGVAALASLTLAALVAGLLLGGTVVRPPTTTVTVTAYLTVRETVEIQVRHQVAASSASAGTVCIYDTTPPEEDIGCERNTKVVLVKMTLRQLGADNAYVNLKKIIAMTPGLEYDSAYGGPYFVDGRILVEAGRTAELVSFFRVTDLRSFRNWMNDIGIIAVGLAIEDLRGDEVGVVMVEEIPVEEVQWSFRGGVVG